MNIKQLLTLLVIALSIIAMVGVGGTIPFLAIAVLLLAVVMFIPPQPSA